MGTLRCLPVLEISRLLGCGPGPPQKMAADQNLHGFFMTLLLFCSYHRNEMPIQSSPGGSSTVKTWCSGLSIFGGKEHDPFEKLVAAHRGSLVMSHLHDRDPCAECISSCCTDCNSSGNCYRPAAGHYSRGPACHSRS